MSFKKIPRGVKSFTFSIAVIIGLCCLLLGSRAANETVKLQKHVDFVKDTADSAEVEAEVISKSEDLYSKLGLAYLGLSKQAFAYALQGYNKLLGEGKIKNEDVLSIIDFTLPSFKKRLFVLDIKAATVVFNTYVSHGKNSGKETATKFSNAPNSFKSSLGFYVTGDTYMGHHGYSLRLEGEEAGINDNALNRGIVMHSADYVNENFIHSQGYIGRSEGCPAIPEKLHKDIIEKIKNGSCLFLYGNDRKYFAKTKIIKKQQTQA